MSSVAVLAPRFDGPALLHATAQTLYEASRLMRRAPEVAGGEALWNGLVDRIDAAEEACRRRLPIGGADYLEDFASDLRELVDLVPPGTRRMLYAALAMLPALRKSMSDSPEPERTHPT